MRLHRFYINKPLGEEIVVENVDSEKNVIHQWTHVFRYTSGDEVFLFSNSNPGTDHLYTLTSVSKQSITLAPVSSSPNIIPLRKVVLVMALVKKDTFETITRQATELGVSGIIPIEAARSEKKNLNFDRLSAISTEASEQSGRGDVPSISPIVTFADAVLLAQEGDSLVGSLHGEPFTEIIQKGFAQEKTLFVWVGPEGGWTEEEGEQFRAHGFTMMKMTETVLKADTATTSLLSGILSSFH